MSRGLGWTMAATGRDCKTREVARSRGNRSNRGMARRPALDEAVDLFLDHIKVERGLARHTLEAYSRDLARAVGFLSERGHAEVDDVSGADLTDYLIALAEAGLALAAARARWSRSAACSATSSPSAGSTPIPPSFSMRRRSPAGCRVSSAKTPSRA